MAASYRFSIDYLCMPDPGAISLSGDLFEKSINLKARMYILYLNVQIKWWFIANIYIFYFSMWNIKVFSDEIINKLTTITNLTDFFYSIRHYHVCRLIRNIHWNETETL